ncbi:MAG: four helix bundle protein [Bacteroidota bacterium]
MALEKKYDYLERLIAFAGEIILFSKSFSKDFAGNVLARQIIRSSSSVALNFGETQGTVTTKDYISKASICLKEQKETEVNLRILAYVKMGGEKGTELLDECIELAKICRAIIKNKQKELSNS